MLQPDLEEDVELPGVGLAGGVVGKKQCVQSFQGLKG